MESAARGLGGVMRRFALLALLLPASACIPYAVGRTAATVRPGDVVPSATMYFIPGGVERRTTDSSAAASLPLFGVDAEARFGVDDRSDFGVRVPGGVGAVLTYKRRLDDGFRDQAVSTSFMAGIGVINAGDHAHFELSLIVSGRENDALTPYGGLRAMQVVPLTPTAVSDTPTLGGFVGTRFGQADLGVSVEVGVFWDKSALHLRDNDVIVVPSFTVHGEQLIRALFGHL